MFFEQQCCLESSRTKEWTRFIPPEDRPILPPTPLQPDQGHIVESLVKTLKHEFQAMRDNQLAHQDRTQDRLEKIEDVYIRLEKIEGSLGKLLDIVQDGNGDGFTALALNSPHVAHSTPRSTGGSLRSSVDAHRGKRRLSDHTLGKHKLGEHSGQQHEQAPCYVQKQEQEEGQAEEPDEENRESERSTKYDEYRAHRNQTQQLEVKDSRLAKFVNHPWFDSVIATVVAMNALLVGLQIEHDTHSAKDFKPYTYIEYACTGIFTFELVLRIGAMKQRFCGKANRYWAIFDVTLVLISWADVALAIATGGDGSLPGPGASIAKTVKMARMARLVRIIRMVKWLAKVRIMTSMIVGSMISLFWLFVLIIGVMYIFALVLTQGCTDWLRPSDDPPPMGHAMYADMEESYGGVLRSMYTLFLAMTGGVSWGEPAELTKEMGAFQWAIFCFFVFFTFFSVLNIVTGVFVDGAIQQANNDRSVLLMEQAARNKMMQEELMELISSMDEDDDGFVTKEEWNKIYKDPRIQCDMELMGFNVDDADRLFKMLDTDGDGVVSIEEYVDGMQKFRGPAQSIDVHVVLSRVNYIIAKMELGDQGLEQIQHHHSHKGSRIEKFSMPVNDWNM